MWMWSNTIITKWENIFVDLFYGVKVIVNTLYTRGNNKPEFCLVPLNTTNTKNEQFYSFSKGQNIRNGKINGFHVSHNLRLKHISF